MWEFAEKFTRIEKKISKKFGEFILFGIFLQEENPNWDLVISASWLKRNDEKKLNHIAKILNEVLKEDIIKVSKVVVIEPNKRAVMAINKVIKTEHNATEFQDCNFFGLDIKHAFIITSKVSKEIIKEAKFIGDIIKV